MSQIGSSVSSSFDSSFQPDRKLLVEKPYEDVQKAAQKGWQNNVERSTGNFKMTKKIRLPGAMGGIDRRIQHIWNALNYKK